MRNLLVCAAVALVAVSTANAFLGKNFFFDKIQTEGNKGFLFSNKIVYDFSL